MFLMLVKSKEWSVTNLVHFQTLQKRRRIFENLDPFHYGIIQLVRTHQNGKNLTPAPSIVRRLKLSLPVFLKCFLIFPQFQPHVSYKHVSYKKTCSCAVVHSNCAISFRTAHFVYNCMQENTLRYKASLLSIGRYLMLIFRLYLKLYTPPSHIFNNLEDLAVSVGHTTWKSLVLFSA